MSRNTDRIPFFRPYIRSAEIRAARRVLKSGWLTTGPDASAFESDFAAFIDSGRPGTASPGQALTVNSATSGLHLALEAVGVGPGDLVAVPSMTFTSTAEVVRYLNADPVFIDSHPDTGNMDPEHLNTTIRTLKRSGKHLKAVIAVHLAGLPCDMPALSSIAANENCVLIEDAAHAFPSRTPDGMAGDLGDIGVFSFYATKTITTGEGGMVYTRNADYLNRMRTMRLHGIDRAVWNRYTSSAASRSWEYDVVEAGYKYNMTDLAAAVGRVQLSRADHLFELRCRIAEEYNRSFAGHSSLNLPPSNPSHAHHLYILGFGSLEKRNRAAEHLHKQGIGCSVHFIPLHRMTYWKERYSLNPADFPVAETMADRNLSIPLWPGLRNKDIRRIIREVRVAADGR